MKTFYTSLNVQILFLFQVLFLYIPKQIYCESKCQILLEGSEIQKSNMAKGSIHYYCFSSNSLTADFFFFSSKGASQLFGYHSHEGNDLNFTEDDITIFLLNDLFEIPSILNNQAILQLSLSKKNDPEDKNQYLLIVYCLEIEGCDYSIMYLRQDKPSVLKENKLFYSLILKNNSLKYLFNQINFPVNDNAISLYLECVIISGNIDVWLEKNSEILDNYTTMYSANAIKFIINGIDQQDLNDVEIKVTGLENSVYSLKYILIKSDDLSLFLDSNTIQFHEIQLNKNKTFTFPETLSSEFPVIFNIKTENCYVTVKENEKENAKEVKLYQTILKDINAHNIELSLSSYTDKNNHNQKDFCTFYTYNYQYTSTTKLIIPELIPITTILNNDINRMTYLYYFVYQEDDKENDIKIELNISEGGLVSLQYHYNNIISSSQGIENIFGNYVHSLLSDYKIYCNPSKLCVITILIDYLSKDIEAEFTISVYHVRKISKYINKNEIIYHTTFDGLTHFFYTSTIPGDKGKISINGLSGTFLVSANLIRKNEKPRNKENKNKNINTIFKNYFGDINYEISQDEECEYGCELEISVKNDDKCGITRLMTFHLFIMNGSGPTISPLHKKITNKLENEESIHSYLFTLPKNIFKFQLIIEGESCIFEMFTTPNITNTSETFTAPNGPNFIDKEIPFTNSEVNAQIIIKVKSKKYSIFGSYYEIKVIPFNIFDDKPVYFITDTKEIEVYTGKSSSKAYLIFEDKDLFLRQEYGFYGSVQNDLDAFVKFIITPYYESQISLVDPSKVSEYFKETSDTVYCLGQNYQDLKLGFNYKYFFIIIEGVGEEANNLILNCNFNRREDFSFEHSEIYFYDSKPQLYIFPSYSKAQTMKFLKYEMEDTSSIVWIVEFLYLDGKGTLSANQIQLQFQDSIIYVFPKEGLSKFNEFEFYIGPASIDDLHFTALTKFGKRSNYIQKLDIYTPYTIMNMGILPFRFYYTLDKDFPRNMVNIKISQQSFDPNKIYNFTNLEIIAFYANDTTIEKYRNNETTTDNLITPNVVNFESEMLSILSFTINENEALKYDKLYFEINEKKPTENLEILNNMKLYINSFSLSEEMDLPLAENRYIYGYIDPEFAKVRKYFLYCYDKEKLVIEFASCTNDLVTIDFDPKDKKPTKNTDSGRDIYTFNDLCTKDSVGMTITLTSDSKEPVYFVMKCSFYEKYESEKEYQTERKILSKYDKEKSMIESEWGKIINLNKDIKVQYFYTLYEASNTKINSNSICSPINKVYNTITNTNKTTWNNTNNKQFDYVSVAIAFFIDEKGEHLLSFGSHRISGGGRNYTILIIAVVFIFVIILVALLTWWLFKQIKKRRDELDEKENVEFEKRNRESFAKLYEESEKEVSLEKGDNSSNVLVLPKENN